MSYDGNKITIRHLLSNTSGLFSTGLAPGLAHRCATRAEFDKHRFDEHTTEELLRLAVSQPAVGEPGERFEYSNGGFYIAGAIIEKVTGNSYAEEVERRVIRPLGLTGTYVHPSQDTGYPDPHPRAYSDLFYTDGTDVAAVTRENWESMIEKPGLEPLDVTEFNTSWSWSAGDVVSTTRDRPPSLASARSSAVPASTGTRGRLPEVTAPVRVVRAPRGYFFNWIYGPRPARLGRGSRRARSLSRLSTRVRV